MNKIILTGRLVADAELSFIPNIGTPKQVFRLAVERKYQKDKNNKKVDFIPCEQLGKHVENLNQYLTKGKMIGVEGELHIENYTNQAGENKSFTKIKVDSLEFMGGDSKNSNSNDNQKYEFEPTGLDPQGFQAIEDDDIPF